MPQPAYSSTLLTLCALRCANANQFVNALVMCTILSLRSARPTLQHSLFVPFSHGLYLIHERLVGFVPVKQVPESKQSVFSQVYPEERVSKG